jgi:hypothetical protein
MTSDVLSLEWAIDNEEATFGRLLSKAQPRCSPNFLDFGQICFRNNAEIVPASLPSPFERFIDDER